MGVGVLREAANRGAVVLGRGGEIAVALERDPVRALGDEVVRLDADGGGVMRKSFLEAAAVVEGGGEVVLGDGVVRCRGQRVTEDGDAVAPDAGVRPCGGGI